MSQPKAYAIDFVSFIKERTSNFTGRDWVFGKINAWLSQKDAGRVFLLTGEPGSGKTAIAARLAQFSAGEAKPPAGLQQLGLGFLHAVHFCSATSSDWTDPHTFACLISLQLAAIPEFAAALKDIGDKEINIDVQISTGAVADGAAVTGMPGDAWDVLLNLRQFVEKSLAPSPMIGDEEPEEQYRLYHQSVVDFLRRRQITIVVDGQNRGYDNVYRVVTEDWHKRIVATYRGNARSWEEVERSR